MYLKQWQKQLTQENSGPFFAYFEVVLYKKPGWPCDSSQLFFSISWENTSRCHWPQNVKCILQKTLQSNDISKWQKSSTYTMVVVTSVGPPSPIKHAPRLRPYLTNGICCNDTHSRFCNSPPMHVRSSDPTSKNILDCAMATVFKGST